MGYAGNLFRRCLETLDVRTACRCWKEIAPHCKQPKDDFEALVSLHYARTVARSIKDELRIYSHEWLIDRELPSGLPEELKPKPQHQIIAEAVGVSVKAFSAASIPLAKAIEKAMSDAVAECYADGKRDPAFVRSRMEEARQRTLGGS